MKLTIIPSDNFVALDGAGKNLDLSGVGLDQNIHAVQWDGARGFVERKSGGVRAIFDLTEFEDVIDLFNAPEPEPPAPSLAEHLAAYRYAVEVGGITISGVAVQTDRETRANLIGARILAIEDQNYSIIWKTAGGFVTLSAAQIVAIADAVAAHVQKCFAAEAAVAAQLGGLTTPQDVEASFDEALNS